MRKLNDWAKNFKENRVQDGNLEAGDFLSAETAVLVTGPPIIAGAVITDLIPLGLVQNFSINQGKQIFTYNEVGSAKPFMIPGRTRVTASISRILFDGASLMKAVYFQTDSTDATTTLGSLPENMDPLNSTDMPTNPYLPTSASTDDTINNDFFSNLRSSFFNKPVGLGVILYDNESQAYGGFYLEECYINGHNLSLASQAVVIMENISLFATSVVPLNPESFELVPPPPKKPSGG